MNQLDQKQVYEFGIIIGYFKISDVVQIFFKYKF